MVDRTFFIMALAEIQNMESLAMARADH